MVSMSRRFSSSGILVLTISSVMAVSGACTLQPDMSKLDRGTGGTGTNGYANGGANGTGGTDGSSSSSTPVKDNDDTCTNYSAPARPQVMTPVDDRVASVISQLTPQQKIDMLNGGPLCPNWDCDFNSTGVPNFTSQDIKIPDWRMADGPRGMHILSGGKATTWAVAIARAASFDTDLEYRVGLAQGQEAPALGIDLVLAPTVNVLRHPAWARAQETYGEDPVLQGELGAAFVRGIQKTVGACVKHFVGNDTDNNRDTVIATMEEATLREIYARPFQIIVDKSDPACIMAAYNGVNGDWSTENKHLLTDILRSDWKWTGVALSDWWATKKNGAKSLNAGLDLEMPDKSAFIGLPQELTKGNITLERIDEAASRILNARAKFGQLADYPNPNPGIVNDTGHQALARETAEKGAVLLKNDNILPLGAKAAEIGQGLAQVKSIIVIGPDALLPVSDVTTKNAASGLGDRGSSATNPPYAISILQGLKERADSDIALSSGSSPTDAAKADVAIIPVAMAHEDEGEHFDGGQDRQVMHLAGPHPFHWPSELKPAAFIAQAAAANPNIVVLLMVGSAILPKDDSDLWMSKAKGIVQTFYPGQEGGHAVARLLFGDINFSAKLPFTVAAKVSDYPAFQNATGTSTVEYLHGYRRIEKNGATPIYWFGYGQSYTQYTYSDLKVLCSSGVSATGRLTVEVTVANAGKMAGDEIVQLYVGYPPGTPSRPPKKLTAFTRVSLNPGESKKVQLSVAAKDIATWDNGWVVEKTDYVALVGPSADPKSLLSVPFSIK
jgi:beta-glucosidase